MEQIDFKKLSTCAGLNFRRTARAITKLYDESLQPSGLRVTQFSLLVNIAKNQPVALTQLAETSGMDRTTLTRGLEPLEKQGLVASTEGEDQRVRLISLTAEGQQALLNALPYWEHAQNRIVEGLGMNRYHGLLDELKAVVKLAE